MADAAQEAAAAIFQDGDEAPVQGEQPDTPVVEPVEIPSFSADTEGIEDLLDAPDFEEEPPAVVQQQQSEEEYQEYVDPAELQARLARAERELEYERKLRVDSNVKGWREEAARRFPLADVDEIQATSRRAMMKKAQEQHERYERKIQPVIEKLDALRSEVIQEAKAEGREQSAQAWGAPTSGPQVPTVAAAETDAKLDRRQYKTVHEMVRARFNNDPRFTGGI